MQNPHKVAGASFWLFTRPAEERCIFIEQEDLSPVKDGGHEELHQPSSKLPASKSALGRAAHSLSRLLSLSPPLTLNRATHQGT